MSFSDVWENMILKHRFNIQSWVTTDLYVGLSSSDPLDDSSGVSEPTSGKGYARVKTTEASSTSWQVVDATGTTVDNSVAIEFPAATEDWGTLTYGVLYSGATSGSSILASGALTSSKTIESGDIARFAAGSMNFGLK